MVLVDRWHACSDVRRACDRLRAGRLIADPPDGIRRFQQQLDPQLLDPRNHVARERRHLRGSQYAGRRRVWGGLAPGRHAGEQAERLRRLYRCGRVSDCRELHERRASGYSGREQRWAPRGCRFEPASRSIGAVVCTYPLLDMVRYHQFLVASFWVPEYGSSEDPEQFAYIYATRRITTSRMAVSIPPPCTSPGTATHVWRRSTPGK